MTWATRRLATWIACFAILFAALAPSISYALPSSAGPSMIEICSASGMRFVSASEVGDNGLPKSVTQKLSHFEHCPFCASHGGDVPILPVHPLTVHAPALPDSRPALFYHAPRTLAVWASAQSRAPPAHA